MKYFVLALTMALLCNSCVKEECKRSNYLFEIPATLSPAKDTFSVGDTISIRSVFPDKVYERRSGKEYDLKDFLFYPQMGLGEISDSVINQAALSQFEVLVDEGYDFSEFIYSTGQISYIGEYKYENGEYSLRYQLIPKEPGFFVFAHSSAIYEVSDDRQDFPGKCKNLSEDVFVELNDGADNNIDLLKNSPDPHYNTWILQKPDQRFHKSGAYCFYVK